MDLDPLVRRLTADRERLDVLDRRRFSSAGSGITEHEPDPPGNDGGFVDWALVLRDGSTSWSTGSTTVTFTEGYAATGSALTPASTGITVPSGVYWVHGFAYMNTLFDGDDFGVTVYQAGGLAVPNAITNEHAPGSTVIGAGPNIGSVFVAAAAEFKLDIENDGGASRSSFKVGLSVVRLAGGAQVF